MAYKIEFLLCGSANDAFYSQAAMFRKVLDGHGGIYRAARLVMCLDSGEPVDIPDRWRPWLERVEFHSAPVDREVVIDGERIPFADSRLFSYRHADPDAALSFICDADTLLLRPFEPAFLESLVAEPAVAAVMAHFPPPLVDASGRALALGHDEFWHGLFEAAVGRRAPLRHAYSMEVRRLACPFYVNYGFVAAPPALLRQLHPVLEAVEAPVRGFLENIFYGQMALAAAVEKLGLPVRALPLRYNFPNDRRADAMHPDELANVHLLHYLRTRWFDRHRIFADEDAFAHFLALPLGGSDARFRDAVVAATGGVYPFPVPSARVPVGVAAPSAADNVVALPVAGRWATG